jgi:type IV pilus assembly protein PilW
MQQRQRNRFSGMKYGLSKQQAGFSLLEIFVALAIGLVLFAGVMSVFVGLRTTTEETSSYGELQENGRFAVSLLSDDLLAQNFFGDLGGNFSFSAMSSVPVVAGSDCLGNGLNNASFPVAIGHFRTLWGSTVASAKPINCITDAIVGSDLIQIKRAIATQVLPADIDSKRYYLISNQNTGAIFAGGGAVPLVNQGRIWEYQHHLYYVRNDSQGSNTVPVLMQGTLRNGTLPPINFDPLIDGIEMIRFMYGVDTDNDGVVNGFVSANNMTNAYWDRELNVKILAVKIFVLARDILPDMKYENTNTYQLGDLSVNFVDGNGNGDNYRRLLFSSTVTLPNARTDTWP